MMLYDLCYTDSYLILRVYKLTTNENIDATPPFSNVYNRLVSAFMASISQLLVYCLPAK